VRKCFSTRPSYAGPHCYISWLARCIQHSSVSALLCVQLLRTTDSGHHVGSAFMCGVCVAQLAQQVQRCSTACCKCMQAGLVCSPAMHSAV
jgi:hypothetical protein